MISSVVRGQNIDIIGKLIQAAKVPSSKNAKKKVTSRWINRSC